jgi:O-antigen/teichoic acid export membrane protein
MIARLPPPLRATALYALAIAWGKGLSLLMLPLLTAHLSPAEFGRLELLSSAAEIAALLIGAGLVDTLYRFGREAAAEIRGLALILAGLALLLLAAGGMAGLLGTEAALLGLAVAMGPPLGVALAALRLAGDAAGFARAEMLRASAQAACVAVLLLAGFGVAGVLAGGALAAAGAAALLVARGGPVAFVPRGWGRLLAYGLPLIGSGLAGFALGSADRWVLAAHVAPEALGHYGLAVKLALVAAFLTQPFELWWYPRRLGLLAEPGGAARSARIVGLGAACVVLAAAAAAIAGPLLIAAATPPAYHAAAALVPWIAAIVALQSLGSLVNVGCYTGRTTFLPLLANGCAAGVAVLLYLLLIPRLGVAGAIAATLLAQAVRLGLFLILSQRRAPIAYPLGRVALLAGSAAMAAAALQGLPPGPLAAAAGAAALALLALLALLLRLIALPRRAGGLAHA